MKTTLIKGKPYIEVNERVKEFHRLFPNGRIETEIIGEINGVVTMRSKVTPNIENPDRYFTGLAHESKDDKKSIVNFTSHVENCETSAVGRALGFLGIGIDTSIASADEVENAINKQGKHQLNITEKISDKELNVLLELVAQSGSDLTKFTKFLKVDSIENLSKANYTKAVKALELKIAKAVA